MNSDTGRQIAQLTKKKPNSPGTYDPRAAIRVKYSDTVPSMPRVQIKFDHLADLFIILLIALSNVTVCSGGVRIDHHIGDIACPDILP